MRKTSVQLVAQNSEPLIVVDESAEGQDEEHHSDSSSEGSPKTHFQQNQFLLSPWRDARETRKLSLPSPQCVGITASQVRRLSERGETGGPGPRQTEFLATLSQAPAPSVGGRRHSVVTISKVPTALFGRSRRESVASCAPNRLLSGSRRESMVGPPSTEPRGSVHNLQLDIMDDIVQSRKVRMKLWNTSSEKICELKDETGTIQKYTGNRRHSEFVGTTLAPIPSGSKQRRASELPLPQTPQTQAATSKQGIVCSNTDLISILSTLTSSSMEINQSLSSSAKLTKAETPANNPSSHINLPPNRLEKKGWEARRTRLKANRSNSFDASILYNVDNCGQKTPNQWFVQRHQPMSVKGKLSEQEQGKDKAAAKPKPEEKGKVVWDGNSGSMVDAQVLGSVIEDFLRRDSQLSLTCSQQPSTSPLGQSKVGGSTNKGKKSPPPTVPQVPARPKGWFSSTTGRGQDEQGDIKDQEAASTATTCDSSICSTLKDLFVK